MPEVRRLVTVLLMLLSVVSAIAQRHSGDTEQGYFNKPADPILNIEDAATKKWTYVRLSELKQRKKTEFVCPDARTGTNASFEGVLLNELINNSWSLRFEVFKGGFFRDKLAFRSEDFELSADTIVVFSRNGKSLGPHPFWLIAKGKQGELVVLRDLAFIRVE